MPIDESLYDQARRYAVALLAEGRTRLRDQEPSVPGALVAEVFWHIESILPHLSRCQLDVKSRLIVNALFEQFGFFLLPFLQRLNRRKMVERTLWNQLVVSFHIALKRCLQLSC